MVLSVDAIVLGVFCSNIVQSVEGYEAAFEQLNHLVREGFVLQKALIMKKRIV